MKFIGNLKLILNKIIEILEKNLKIFEKISDWLLVKFNSISI